MADCLQADGSFYGCIARFKKHFQLLLFFAQFVFSLGVDRVGVHGSFKNFSRKLRVKPENVMLLDLSLAKMASWNCRVTRSLSTLN